MEIELDTPWPTQEVLANRYQNQPWYIKLWRWRWNLMVPVWFLRRVGHQWVDGYPLHPKFTWSICRGTAHHKMDWWYTWEEVDARLQKVLDDR
jgi:hypothetical protein